MELVVVLVLFGSGVAAWAKGLHEGAKALAEDGDPEERMARMERAIAVSDLLCIAVLADGVVTDEEWAKIRGAAAVAGFDGRAVEARFRGEARSLRDPGRLRDRIARAATRATAEDRAQVLRAVIDLARGGSGAAVVQGVGYRASEGSDPEALVDAFARGLRVDPRTFVAAP